MIPAPRPAGRQAAGGRLHADPRGERQRGHQPGVPGRQGARAGHLLRQHDDGQRHRAEDERRGRRDPEPERPGAQRGRRPAAGPAGGGRPTAAAADPPGRCRRAAGTVRPMTSGRDAEHQVRQVRHDQRDRPPTGRAARRPRGRARSRRSARAPPGARSARRRRTGPAPRRSPGRTPCPSTARPAPARPRSAAGCAGRVTSSSVATGDRAANGSTQARRPNRSDSGPPASSPGISVAA